jgi:hypothetical protein
METLMPTALTDLSRLEEPLFQPVEARWQWIAIEDGEPGFLRFRDWSNPLLQERGDKG